MQIILNETEISEILLDRFTNMRSCTFSVSNDGKLEANLSSEMPRLEAVVSDVLLYVREMFPAVYNTGTVNADNIKNVLSKINMSSEKKVHNIKILREEIPSLSLYEAKVIVEKMMSS